MRVRVRIVSGRGQCARSRRSFPPRPPPFLFPVFLSAAEPGYWQLPVGAPRSATRSLLVVDVLRSLRHVSESRALGAPAPGLQQHHPDVQWQHPADQSSQ